MEPALERLGESGFARSRQAAHNDQSWAAARCFHNGIIADEKPIVASFLDGNGDGDGCGIGLRHGDGSACQAGLNRGKSRGHGSIVLRVLRVEAEGRIEMYRVCGIEVPGSGIGGAGLDDLAVRSWMVEVRGLKRAGVKRNVTEVVTPPLTSNF